MGKFIIKKTNTGFNFHLKAANGQTIATGEVYKELDTCHNGVQSVIKNAAIANIEDQTVENFEELKHPKFELYKDKSEQFRFRLKAKNGEVIAVSESYTTKANCKNGINSVIKNVEDAKVIEEIE
ncbi:MAG: YegP family protein [Oscillospiraceae bacterium]|nr:YegP family protein [Oscillospiraceae bacterium]